MPADPIRSGGVVKPGDRDFPQVVLSPGARAISIPVATGGASSGLLYPGDRVDVVLTRKFTDTGAPLTPRSVVETVVENLRVLVIDASDAKAAFGSTFGRTVTLEVTPEQAEKVNVAAELGKLTLTLRSVTTPEGVSTTLTTGPVHPVRCALLPNSLSPGCYSPIFAPPARLARVFPEQGRGTGGMRN